MKAVYDRTENFTPHFRVEWRKNTPGKKGEVRYDG